MFERDGASQHNPDSMNPDSIRPDEISDPSGGWGPLADAVGSCDALTAQAADLAADVFASLRMMETVNSSLPTGCRESIAAKLSVAAARLAHAAQRLHVAAVGVAASEQVHHRDGVTTIAYWVALHHGLTRRDAQRLLRAGLTTERYEQVRASFEAGDITLGHVDAISSIIPDRYTGERLDAAIDAVRDIEPLLLGTASRCSLNQFERFCRSIRDRLDQDGPSDPNAEPSRISLSRTFNGRWHLNGDLTADDGAIVATILHDLINRQARDNTNDGGGWDIRLHHFTGLEDHGYPRRYLNFTDEVVPPLAIEPVRQAMRLNGVEALEIEQRLDHARAGRVAVIDGGDVDAEDVSQLRLGGEHLGEGLADQIAGDVMMVEPVGDAMGDRLLERMMVEDVTVDEARQLRLGSRDRFRLGANPLPNGVEAGEALRRRWARMRAHFGISGCSSLRQYHKSLTEDEPRIYEAPPPESSWVVVRRAAMLLCAAEPAAEYRADGRTRRAAFSE